MSSLDTINVYANNKADSNITCLDIITDSHCPNENPYLTIGYQYIIK